jgi:Transcription factor WhiB
MTATAAYVSQATDRLTRALITTAARGIRPRCGDYETSYLWLSEDAKERRHTARMCVGCQLLEPCADVGRHQRFGVWGGKDFTRRPGQRKAS